MNNKRAKILKAYARIKAKDTNLTPEEFYKRLKLVDVGSENNKKNIEQYRQIRKEVLNYRRLKRKESES